MAKQMKKQKTKKEDKTGCCDPDCDCKDCRCMSWKCHYHKGCGGCFYFLGALGSAIYFISHTSGFWNVVLAILKAMVWPVFIIMKILGLS